MKNLTMLRKNEWTPELLYKEFLEANQLSRRKKAFMKECGGMRAKFEISYVNQRNRVLGLS